MSVPGTWDMKTGRAINRIIIHHSEGKNDTFNSIHKWQITKDDPNTPGKEGMGWSNVAYHFIIERDGSIHPGVSEAVPSGGTLSTSRDSLEVCLCGDFDFQVPDAPALARLRLLLTNWCKTYSLVPGAMTIVGHKDIQPLKGTIANRCPGKNLSMQLPALRNFVSANINRV